MIQIIGPQLSQWDTGRSLGASGSAATHAHFANRGDSHAVIMELVDGKTKIPDYLLQTGKDLCVYLVLEGVTQESKTFSVRKREKPENYVYEDDRRNYIYALITDALAATAAANSAAGAANNAAQNATNAATSANDAAGNANVAGNSANEAAKNANDAATKAAHTAKSLMVIGGADGTVIHMDNAADQVLVGLRIFGKTTQNGTPSPDVPVELKSVGDSGNIVAKVACENLAEPMRHEVFTETGVTFSPTGDGNLILNGTNSGELWKSVYRLATVKGQTYTISGALGIRIVVWSTEAEQQVAWKEPNQPYIRFTANYSKYVLCISHNANETFNNLRVDCAAYLGDTALPWKPYNGQTLTLSTPNGLPGIPVTSGGNYTDANGQQWICDEIDLARGVYVQRVCEYITPIFGSNGTASEGVYLYSTFIPNARNVLNTKTLSTHFKWMESGALAQMLVGQMIVRDRTDYPVVYCASTISGESEFNTWVQENNVRFLSIRATPIETPLSAEELAAYSALRTYRDNTTVSNDASAHMELEYVMDAKKYIESLIIRGGIARLSNITLRASAWQGSDNLYSQVVTIDGITEYSKVDLLPSVEQLAIFHNKDLAFVTENEDGVVTVYAIGDKPTQDYTMQVQITEVVV